jgi:hypothetical protein
VCWLMNSRSPISAFERPAPARRAICDSWTVSASRLDPAFADTFAGGQHLAFGAPGERLEPHRNEHLERRAQLLARVQAAPLSAQPLAVEEVGAG